MSLRGTLEKCEEVVGAMLGCIYDDIPHLLDQIDSGAEGAAGGNGGYGVGNWNPKSALDGISQLFYVSLMLPPSFFYSRQSFELTNLLFSMRNAQSYQDLLSEKRELLADFTCEEITPAQFVAGWTSIDNTLATQRKQQVDDLADLLAAF